MKNLTNKQLYFLIQTPGLLARKAIEKAIKEDRLMVVNRSHCCSQLTWAEGPEWDFLVEDGESFPPQWVLDGGFLHVSQYDHDGSWMDDVHLALLEALK
jgi:hypothetical protein